MTERRQNNKFGPNSVFFGANGVSQRKILDGILSVVKLRAPNRPQESGPVEFSNIPVTDANGDELTVYEFHERRFLRKVRRMKLCTGELVEALDENMFVLVGTGEKLTRV